MANLAQELTSELQRATMPWWQRAALIVAANALGTLVGGGLIGFCAIVWSKANSTDELRSMITGNAQIYEISQREILTELAKLKAAPQHVADPAAVVVPDAAPLAEPTSAEVEKQKEELQKRLDKAIYRQQQMRSGSKQ